MKVPDHHKDDCAKEACNRMLARDEYMEENRTGSFYFCPECKEICIPNKEEA